MVGLKSKTNQNCKLLGYADDVGVYSVRVVAELAYQKWKKYTTLFK
jgi:hypothetical protein